MHPEIRQEMPGMCPECGMQLIPQKTGGHKNHGNSEYDTSTSLSAGTHAGHSTRMFLRKFWVSLALTIPVLLYADVVQDLIGWSPPAFAGSAYLPLALGSIVFFYGGWVFLAGAVRELRARLPGMMTLIGLAIIAAYLYSVYAVFAGGHTLFWELTTLITVMLLGHWLEMRAVSGAQGALKELSKLLPDTAEVLRDGAHTTIPLSGLREGDQVLVRPGGRIPADGIVIEGASDVNEAVVTGESAPVAKTSGSEVIAGTINGDGALTIRVTKLGERTFLAGVMRLIREAEASKSRLQILSDRAAFYLTVVAIGAGGLTFIAWLGAKAGAGFAFERLVAVLVIACPHALGLAVPLVASISTTLAAHHGFLVRQRLSLELARKVGIVLFDKTGTLTTGEYGITNIWTVGASDEAELLRTAASVDARSEHFISRAIVTRAKAADIALREVRDFSRIAGKGVSAVLDGETIFVGGAALLNDHSLSVPEALGREIGEESKKGKTIIYAFTASRVLGVFALADLIREESREAVRGLKAMGVRVAMMTGDSEHVARWVAHDLGIDEYFAKVLPHEKSEKVKALQSKGFVVAMVGDGINDAPALTQADLGIAIGAGTNVAIESAGIILVRNDPRDIPKIIRLSRLTYTKMLQNLFWASGYNVVALPLAAGVLAPWGVMLQPAVAALLMSASTVIVAVNAVLLRRVNI
ncbi:MAG: heavy metal translocating P-type ATPase [Candidatus Niyogibacteria bacterium]|nr:heavy metal translocating P-type ATPase [Candidatus Niyogibacteria bacterium]